MYDPVKDGVAKTVESVIYTEARPLAALGQLVHCFWELRTETDLADDFSLHAMPDACVNLLFDQRDPRIAGVTQLHTTHMTLDLGRSFHYAGIQFFPGVWRGDPDLTVDHYVGEPYEGDLPLGARRWGCAYWRAGRRMKKRRLRLGIRYATPCIPERSGRATVARSGSRLKGMIGT